VHYDLHVLVESSGKDPDRRQKGRAGNAVTDAKVGQYAEFTYMECGGKAKFMKLPGKEQENNTCGIGDEIERQQENKPSICRFDGSVWAWNFVRLAISAVRRPWRHGREVEPRQVCWFGQMCYGIDRWRIFGGFMQCYF